MPNIRKIVVGGDESYLAWASSQERSMRRSLEDNKATGKAGAFEPQAGGYRTRKFDMGDGTEVEIRVQPSMSLIIIRGNGKVVISEIAYVFGKGYPSPSTATAVIATPKTDGGLAFYPEQAPLTVNPTGASSTWMSPDKAQYVSYVGARTVARGYRSFIENRYQTQSSLGLDGSVFPTDHAVSAACVIAEIGAVYAHIQIAPDASTGGGVLLYKANKGVEADTLLATVPLPATLVDVVFNASLFTYRQQQTAADGYALFSPDAKKLCVLARPYGLFDGDITTIQAYYNDYFVPVLHSISILVTDGVLSASLASSTKPYQYGWLYAVTNSFKLRVPVGVTFSGAPGTYGAELCYVETYSYATDSIAATETIEGEYNEVVISTTGSSSTSKYIKVFCGESTAYSLSWSESANFSRVDRFTEGQGVILYSLLNGVLNQRLAGIYIYDYDTCTGSAAIGIYDESKTATAYSTADTRPDPNTSESSYPTEIEFTYSSIWLNRSGIWARKDKAYTLPPIPSDDGPTGYGRYLYGGAGQYLYEWQAFGVWIQQGPNWPAVSGFAPGPVSNQFGSMVGMFDECVARTNVPTPNFDYDYLNTGGGDLSESDFKDTRVMRKLPTGVQDITAQAPGVDTITKLSIGKYPPP